MKGNRTMTNSMKKQGRKLALFILFLIYILIDYNIITDAKETNENVIASVNRYTQETKEIGKNSITKDMWWYYASVAPISEYMDKEGSYNTIYESENRINLLRYKSIDEKPMEYSIKKPYPLFGGAIHDEEGNIYILYGQANDTDDGDKTVISVMKYNRELKLISELKYSGSETSTYGELKWGTKIPFDAGNADMKLNGTTLVITYAREMYSAHQSNHVIYINKENMSKVQHAGAYTSHSFDQRVLVTRSRDYIFIDHGDAFDRGFKLTTVKNGSNNIWDNHEFVSFHFREGANRSFGYNETYAQLGGIEEISNAYVLVASSEKTLSRDVAPTNREYTGSSKARNLFVQFLKKDYMNLDKSRRYLLEGETRTATGTVTSNPKTNLYLSSDAKDYGVIWLTDYERDYAVVNPKLITTEDERIVLMWEKFQYSDSYADEEFIDSYYMILSSDGKVLQDAISMDKARLTANEDAVYSNNKIYWTTLDGSNSSAVLHELVLGEMKNLIDINEIQVVAIKNQQLNTKGVKPKISAMYQGKSLVLNKDYKVSYKDNKKIGKARIIISGMGRFKGSVEINFYIRPLAPTMSNLSSIKNKSLRLEIDNRNGNSNVKHQIVYSTNSDFSDKKWIRVSDKDGYHSIINLKSNKTYYVKVRSYITVDGSRIYSSYSKIEKIKVK